MQNDMNNNQNNNENNNNNFADAFHDTVNKAADGINDTVNKFVNKPRLPGEREATISLVLGIVAAVLLCTGIFTLASLVLGIIGLVYASKSRNLGFTGAIRTAGFVLSLIGIVIGAVVFVIMAFVVGISMFAIFTRF